MKSLRLLLTVLFAFSMSLSFVQTGMCSWVGSDGEEEEIILTRVDNDCDAPYHEQNEGVYAIKDELGVWHTVLDFGTTEIIQAPYSWDDVYWLAGHPLDKPEE